MILSDAEVADLIEALNGARDALVTVRAELVEARHAIDDRDTRIEALEALVAVAEDRAAEADTELIRVEGELARLCAVYMHEVLP